MTTDVTEPATDRPAAPGSRPRAIRVAVLIAVLTLPAIIVAILARDVTAFSVLDEPAQVDALRRVEDLGYPRLGDPILTETEEDIGCRGIGPLRFGSCEDPPPADAIGRNGSSYEARKPPAYFAVTAIARQPIRPFTDDYVLSARLTGILWLSAGLATLWILLTRTGVGLVGRAGIVGLVAGSPVLLHQSATVSNAASLLVLGGALVHGASMLDGRSSWWRVAGVGVGAAIAVSFEPGALLGVAAVAVTVILRDRPVWSNRRGALRLAVVAALPVVLAVAAVVGWEAVRDHRAVSSVDEVFAVGSAADDPSDAITVGEAAEYTGHFLVAHSGTTQVGIVNDRDYTSGLARIALVLLVAGPAVAVVLGGDRKTAFGVAALVAAVAGAWASAFQYHWDFAANSVSPAYYGLVLLPFFAVSLGHQLDGRTKAAVVVALVAAALLAADLLSALEF